MHNILLIEDETLFAKSVGRRLERENYHCTIASTIAAGQEYLANNPVDLVLLDVRLPDGSGLNFLESLRQQQGKDTHALPVIIMTAYGELDDAVSAMKLGANDYLKKPVDLDELILTLAKVFDTQQVATKLNFAQQRDKQVLDQVSMIGRSMTINAVRDQIARIADLSSRSNDSHPVLLIRGETGTGKDVAARLFHQHSIWHDKPYVHIDCASLPTDLMEAELFGFEKGAFTHAHQAKAGLVEIAEEGTLFLDEIGELPLELQAKLLNLLERRVSRRIGSTKEHKVSCHIVVATNRDLPMMVEQGTFRSDLYFRLNILEITLPPLRERNGDIALLANHFLTKVARKYGLQTPTLSDQAEKMLNQYHWPGNVRELQHVLERAGVLCQSGIIDGQDLMLQPTQTAASGNTSTSFDDAFEGMTIESVEKMMIEASLKRSGGNVSKSARELGLTRMAMRYRMDKYQL